jgi:hypothetical protein
MPATRAQLSVQNFIAVVSMVRCVMLDLQANAGLETLEINITLGTPDGGAGGVDPYYPPA